MNIITLILTALLGLCLGSFICVAIYRFAPYKTPLKYGYDITCRRSRCMYCSKKLSYLSLIPVISWLLQGGRCKYCHHKIAMNYLLAELLVATYCCVMIVIYGNTLWSIILILLGLYFIILAIIDFQYLLLPNYFTYPIMLAGLVLSYFEQNPIQLSDGILGIILGYVLLWLPATLYYHTKKHIGLGGGDIKLLSALGAWIHYTQLPVLVVLASIMGILYIILLACLQKRSLKTVIIPFGPSLLIAAYVILLM
ncbi:A24 family peptidase [Orbus sturtevantii]|uniref:prepilin peptidase n=1 Tax=Orbus sturtevantii TaxID=3074109 RepID=UPI00370CFC1B